MNFAALLLVQRLDLPCFLVEHFLIEPRVHVQEFEFLLCSLTNTHDAVTGCLRLTVDEQLASRFGRLNQQWQTHDLEALKGKIHTFGPMKTTTVFIRKRRKGILFDELRALLLRIATILIIRSLKSLAKIGMYCLILSQITKWPLSSCSARRYLRSPATIGSQQ